ncbi:serine hydrolase domain-containing protein [Pseudomonas syringae group genomosp. 3]|nr:serine hydrolase domain-containing protein [Pseudomonas syringae group genomosp. 3]
MSLNGLKYIPVESPAELEVLVTRLRWVHSVFNSNVETLIEQHRSYDKTLCHAHLHPSAEVFHIPLGEAKKLPERFYVPSKDGERLSVDGGDESMEGFLARVNTLGLAVIQQGELVFERYALGNDERTRWMTNSASKFVIGMLIAIAKEEGKIESFDDPVAKYWPELQGTGWEGVTIDHCLRMTSGIQFDEYSLDLWQDGDYIRLMYGVAFGTIEEHVISQGSKATPGVRAEYSSINTEALGGVLVRVTGMSITDYLQAKIWGPAGMEHPAYWVTDPTGRAMALAGLCASLRDYARLGLIMVNGGSLNGRQIVPSWYAELLMNIEPQHFKLEASQSDAVLNWYQVFVPSDPAIDEGDYMASGSYGQNIYVNTKTQTVIATQSLYENILVEEGDMFRHLMAFRAISKFLSKGE